MGRIFAADDTIYVRNCVSVMRVFRVYMQALSKISQEPGSVVVLRRRGTPTPVHRSHTVHGSHLHQPTQHSGAPYTPHRSRVASSLHYHEPSFSLISRFGLNGAWGRMAIRALMWLLVFQPVYVALGMELEPATDNTLLTPVVETVSDTPDDIAVPSESAPEQNKTEDESAIADTETSGLPGDVPDVDNGDDGEDVPNMEGDELPVGELLPGEDTGEPGEDAVDTGGAATDTDSGSGGTGSGTTDDEGEPALADGEVLGTATTTDDTATSTDALAEEGENDEGVTGIPQNPENAFIFSDGDCTLVAEGEFYCVKNDTPRIEGGDPRVYAEKDREGDREIYYFDGVEIRRITNNSYDDFAPVFDEETLRIVWQAMLNDRLQVMLYEIPTDTTRQITSSQQNSSNPDIEGDVVVWQEWVDTNWEIMMTNVDVAGGEFDIERLTDNAVHDMFPRAYEDLITWQSERGSSWEVIVYDLRTEKTTTLEKDEGTKYENPRFVLLFDSKHENGDVETIGYDLDTGEMMELGTRANPQPQTPASPKDEAPDALPREATANTLKVKVGKEGDLSDDDLPL